MIDFDNKYFESTINSIDMLEKVKIPRRLYEIDEITSKLWILRQPR